MLSDWRRARVFFYRNQKGLEVDLLVVGKHAKLIPFEFELSVLPGFACDFFNDGVVSKLCRELCRELCRCEILVLIVILIVIVIEPV